MSNETRHRYAYLHGFASGPGSRKGTWLRERLAARGVALHLPDLNRPSFAELTLSGALSALDEMDRQVAPEGAPWRLIGSSMGGYLAARWTELHPERVDRIVLLCPGFDLVARWGQILGEEALRRWRERGSHPFPDASGRPVEVRSALIEDAERHPPFPEPARPTLIVHGVRDEVVPIDVSRRHARGRPALRLVEVDDDHALLASVGRIEREVLDFFGIR